MRTVYSYNCFNRRIRVGDVVMYSGREGKGTRVATHPTNNEWTEVNQGTPTPSLVLRIREYCG